MNRRSFLHRLTATAGTVCAGFALELQPREPNPELDFDAIWTGVPGGRPPPPAGEWSPTQFSSKAVQFHGRSIMGDLDDALRLASLVTPR